MANNPVANSSNSNRAYEIGLGFDCHTNNFYAGATPPLRASNPTIMRNGQVGQFQLNQKANGLIRTREIMGWIQGRVRIQSCEGGHQVLGAGSSSTTPNPYEVGASSAHGNIRTTAQLLGASSSSSLLIIGTVTAKELMDTQILYQDPSIWKHLRANLNFNDNGYDHGIRAPSPGLGLDLQNRSSQQQTPVASNYQPDISNPIISIHSSYPNHSSFFTWLTNTITHPHNLNAQYNQNHCPSSSTIHNSADENKHLSAEKYFHRINLTEITKELNKNKNKHPAIVSAPPHQINNMGLEIDSNDGDDGRIRSLPHKKNGPYTCAGCNQEFPTSQHFANHVRAKHYKRESKAQRSKRLMSKLRPRNLCIGKVNGQITCLPVSSSKAQDIVGNSFASRFDGGNRPFAVKVEVDKEVGLQDQTSSRNGS